MDDKQKRKVELEIYKAFREAVHNYPFYDTNYKKQLAGCYSSIVLVLKAENYQYIDKNIQQEFKYLLNFSKRQYLDRKKRDNLFPHLKDKNINYYSFFYNLKNNARKTLLAIFTIFTYLDNKICEYKKEYYESINR